jgi:1-acyl-sn-glycerol-3-phosphate acyltransferase
MPLFYFFLKFPVRLALMIFCREIRVRNGALLKTRGPLLLVANHPNSFLDAIIIGSLFSHPVHFLARGDAFKKPWHRRILGLMNMIPVYRMCEGRENLHMNSEAFRKSGEVLNAGGIVLIFIEGICVNKHELQTFKKGAARIANECKHLNNFKVMPIGIAYNSFQQFGKTINVEIGEPVLAKKLLSTDNTVANIVQFNEILRNEIEQKIEVPISKRSDQKKQQLLKHLN